MDAQTAKCFFSLIRKTKTWWWCQKAIALYACTHIDEWDFHHCLWFHFAYFSHVSYFAWIVRIVCCFPVFAWCRSWQSFGLWWTGFGPIPRCLYPAGSVWKTSMLTSSSSNAGESLRRCLFESESDLLAKLVHTTEEFDSGSTCLSTHKIHKLE